MRCSTYFYSFWNVVWIAFEVLDIYGDFKTWYEYKEGRLMPLQDLDVHAQRAFLAFAIIGLFISLFRISLYLFKFGLIWSSDLNKRYKERYNCLDLAVSCALLVEVMPQSIIGFYALKSCPPKKCKWAWLDGLFATTCLLQYFPIWRTFSCHCCCYHETRAGGKPLIILVFSSLAIVGMVFASLTINNFRVLKCFC